MTKAAEGSSAFDASSGPGENIEGLAEIVSRALELRDSGRDDWLSAACGERTELRDRVRALVGRRDVLTRVLGGGDDDEVAGRRLGARFRLIERIGSGAMGVVYLAEDEKLRRLVACKIVRHELMAPEQSFARFEREARTQAAVQHPFVTTIHDFGRTDDARVYLVMEFVDGVALSDLLTDAAQVQKSARSDDNAWIEERFGVARRGESSWLRTVVRWTAELAQGLSAVHGAGVLHRDIKPSNIRVRRDGRPALLDFGIALLDDGNTITRTPTSLGTPSYMPPEALERQTRRTPASDVYSLTATLYHLITLRLPFEGTPTQVLAALATREPTPAATLRPGLPRDLQAILDKGMHRRPSARYAGAAELAADLWAFLEYRPINARPVGPLTRFARRVRRSRAALGAASAVALMTLAGASFAGLSAWRAHELDTRRARHAQIQRYLPPNLTVVSAQFRVSPFESDETELRGLLEEDAEIAPDPLTPLLLRSSFRQDHGDRAGAAQDMARVAALVDTPLVHELAKRYAADSADAIPSLANLPECSGARDRYVLAYLVLRTADRDKEARATELLDDPEVRRIDHAEELRLTIASLGDSKDQRSAEIATSRFAELLQLETRRGTRTAASASIAARMLLAQSRAEEALKAGREGLELAPRSHILRTNTGYAAFLSGALAEAREHLQLARTLRPNYARAAENLVWVELAARDFAAAQRVVDEAHAQLEPPDPTFAPYWSSVVATHAAIDARARGDAEGERAQLERASWSFPDARARTHDVEGHPTDLSFLVFSALVSSDADALVVALASLVRDNPRNWYCLELLYSNMPTDLSAGATSSVTDVLRSLGARDAPERPR